MKYKQEAVIAFVQEARDLLAAMETALLQMALDGVHQAGIDAVFRAVHTIKGSASIFEFEHIVGFTHKTENVLDKVRNATLSLDDAMSTLLLACSDYLSSQIDAIELSKEESPENLQLRAVLEEKLAAYLQQDTQVQQAAVAADGIKKEQRSTGKKKQRRKADANVTGLFSRTPYWYLSLRFDQHLFSYGLNPVMLIQHLSHLGNIIACRVIDEAMPAAKTMNPEQCYLGFELLFHSDASKQDIAAVFDLVADGGSLVVIPPYSDIGSYRDVLANFKRKETSVALLMEFEVLDHEACVVLLDTAQTSRKTAFRQDEPVVAGPAEVQRQQVATVIPRDIPDNQFIKIEVGRLDQLIDLVGELVIAGATASLVARIKRDVRFQETTQAISGLVEKIRDAALTFRMVNINDIFQRFPRVVRETARELGKEIELVITGEETELDKSMMEKIANPLMHLVRNAIDHGIEPVDVRIDSGKDKKGKIILHARQESGSIVIEISDDGRGIDQQKVLAKALEKGLVQDGETLSRADILNLVFLPGFSTADRITAISGRGVGMDVVKRNIDQLHGKVTIDSVPGQGTTMRIRLPLTLAIISGFQVIIGDMVFVLPLDMVVECINMTNYPVNNHIVTLRGEPLSFINMRSLFDMPSRSIPRKNMLIVQYANYRIGLLVDEFQGETQAVVKPLSKLFTRMRGLSGSAILGDGRIALILDVAHLVEYVKEYEKKDIEVSSQRSR